MRNNIYYLGLIILMVVFYVLKTYVFHRVEFLFMGTAVLVFYIWCKDVFTGAGWFKKTKGPGPAPAVESFVSHTFEQFTETISGECSQLNEKEGYLQLMQELVKPSLHPELGSFIENLVYQEGSAEGPEPIYVLSDQADEAGLAFVSLLDWRSAVEDLQWRIKSALLQNYDVVLDLPSKDKWGQEASVSYNNVFKTYNETLNANGFQLGFINTGNDDFAVLVFRIEQQVRVVGAVKLTRYGYFEIISKPTTAIVA